MQDTAEHHQSVLLPEVCDWLVRESWGPASAALDGTLGAGGHSAALLERSPGLALLGLDRDGEAVARAARRLEHFRDRVVLYRANFGSVRDVFANLDADSRRRLRQSECGDLSFDVVLLDLGISSYQLDEPERGFSFRHDGPLDMRMTREGGETAAELINGSDTGTLRRLFIDGGLTGSEAAALAKATVTKRPFHTTREYARLCESVFPRKKGSHAATVPFQALRIAVNREWEALDGFLDVVPEILAPGGRFAVICFHSLEDKRVTKRMRSWTRSPELPSWVATTGSRERAFGEVLTPHAVTPTEAEIEANPRARSARLRVFRRHADDAETGSSL